jgi:hypothetical protein
MQKSKAADLIKMINLYGDDPHVFSMLKSE